MQADTFDKLYSIAQDTLGLAERMMVQGEEEVLRDQERSMWRALLSAFLMKACHSLQATLVLCREGFSEDAAIVARSIAEISIMAMYIRKDWQERSKRFVKHILVQRHDFAERLRTVQERYPEVSQVLSTAGDSLREIYDQYEEMRGDSPHRYLWAGRDVTLAKMAAEVGFEDFYSFIYWDFSQRVHSTPQCMDRYFRWEGERVTCTPPDPAKSVPSVLLFGSVCLLYTLDIVQDEMKLGREQDIQRLGKRLNDARSLLRQVQGESGR
jgi:hypothetical protein